MSDVKLTVGRAGRQVMVRLPPQLKSALEAKAAKDGRSMNAEIVMAVAASVGVGIDGDVEKLGGAGTPPGRRMSEGYPLRMPDGMRDKLHEDANRNDRSLNAEIVARLQRTDESDMLDRIALALLPDMVRGLQDVPQADKPKKAIRDAYHTAKRLLAARAEYLSQ